MTQETVEEESLTTANDSEQVTPEQEQEEATKPTGPYNYDKIPMADRTRNLPEAKEMLLDILEKRGWDKRSGQVKMVRMIADALEEGDWDAIINAPVGIGKSLGYLVAALPSDRHALVCTSTKSLQDQLIDSELPDLARDLKELYDYHLTYQVVKGKANYLCLDAAERILNGDVDEDDDDLMDLFQLEDEDAEDFKSWDPEPLRDLVEDIKNRMERAKAGEVGVVLDCGDQLMKLPPNIRNSVSASKCINHGGKWWEEDEEGDDDMDLDGEGPSKVALPYPRIIQSRTCPLGLAYVLALGSDIGVLNTSLLAAELQKATSMPFPTMATQIRGVDTVIVDESHHLVSIVTNSMRIKLNIDSSIAAAQAFVRRIAKKIPTSELEINKAFSQYASGFREKSSLILGEQGPGHRGDLSREIWEFKNQLAGLRERIERDVAAAMAALTEKDRRTINRNLSRLNEDVIEKMIETAVALTKKSELEEADPKQQGDGEQRQFSASHSYSLSAEFNSDSGNWSLDLVPIDISFLREMFEETRKDYNMYLEGVNNPHFKIGNQRRTSLILCSGTITENVAEIIGIGDDDYEYLNVSSPFDDYAARIFIPSGTTVPKSQDQDWFDYSQNVVNTAVARMNGRTMVLTTSQEMCWHYAAEVQQAQKRGEIPSDIALVWQGGKWTRKEMLDIMANDERSVLFGTKGFWEGVNVPGIALSQVIIDKIPFPVRDDPATAARRKFVERRGGNPFIQVDVDLAAIDLEQGRGRLIRSVDDVGGVIIMDSRIMDSRYGASVTKLFPGDTLVTDSFGDYLKWVDWVNPDNGADQSEYPSERGWRPLRARNRRSR